MNAITILSMAALSVASTPQRFAALISGRAQPSADRSYRRALKRTLSAKGGPPGLDGHGGDHGDEGGHDDGGGGGPPECIRDCVEACEPRRGEPDCGLLEKFIEECEEDEFDAIGFEDCNMPHDGDGEEGGGGPPPCVQACSQSNA